MTWPDDLLRPKIIQLALTGRLKKTYLFENNTWKIQMNNMKATNYNLIFVYCYNNIII